MIWAGIAPHPRDDSQRGRCGAESAPGFTWQGGIEMLRDKECQPGLGRQRVEQLLEHGQPAGRGADTDAAEPITAGQRSLRCPGTLSVVLDPCLGVSRSLLAFAAFGWTRFLGSHGPGVTLGMIEDQRGEVKRRRGCRHLDGRSRRKSGRGRSGKDEENRGPHRNGRNPDSNSAPSVISFRDGEQ